MSQNFWTTYSTDELEQELINEQLFDYGFDEALECVIQRLNGGYTEKKVDHFEDEADLFEV